MLFSIEYFITHHRYPIDKLQIIKLYFQLRINFVTTFYLNLLLHETNFYYV